MRKRQLSATIKHRRLSRGFREIMHSTRKIQSLATTGQLLAALIGGLILALLPGCAMFETSAPLSAQTPAPPVPASTPPAPLAWLTNWVSQPIELAPGFDIESIKPVQAPAIVRPDDLIEVTVWELYEPGKPYSFPVRVSAQNTIEVPLLGEAPVEGRTISQVEASLAEAYRTGEYLQNPRVLVRSLDSPIIKVQVAGAVNRAGFVELTRSDRSVYAAILSAGSLKKSCGTQVAITRRGEAQRADVPGSAAVAPPPAATDRIAEPASPDNRAHRETSRFHPPEQRANSAEDLTVPGAAPGAASAAGTQVAYQPMFSVGDTGADTITRWATGGAVTGVSATGTSTIGPARQPATASATITARSAPPATPPRQATANDSRQADSRPVVNGKVIFDSGHTAIATTGEHATIWYDLALAQDREQLKSIVLAEGDIVTVKEAAPPLRVEGFVNRPGSYPLPPGRKLNAWQVVELAGGVRDETIPLNITLLRPASEGHGARRWSKTFVDYQHHPSASPLVESGDVLQVEPTTGSKIKRAVGDVWSKP